MNNKLQPAARDTQADNKKIKPPHQRRNVAIFGLAASWSSRQIKKLFSLKRFFFFWRRHENNNICAKENDVRFLSKYEVSVVSDANHENGQHTSIPAVFKRQPNLSGAADYDMEGTSYNYDYKTFIKRIQELQQRQFPEFADNPLEGLCSGLASSYLQAALLHDAGSPHQPVETLIRRFFLVSRQFYEGWYVNDEWFDDLNKAIASAQKYYLTYTKSSNNKSTVYDDFARDHPMEFELLEIYPWLQLVLQSQCASSELCKKSYFSQLLETGLNITPSLEAQKISGANGTTDDSQPSYIRTEYWPFPDNMDNVYELVRALPEGHYKLESKDHAIAVSVTHDGYIIFDQNSTPPCRRINKDDSAHLKKILFSSVNCKKTPEESFSIHGVFLNTSEGEKLKILVEKRLQEIIDSLNNGVKNQRTFLHELFQAIFFNNEAAIKQLLDKIDQATWDIKGVNILYYCIQTGRENVATLLLKKVPSITESQKSKLYTKAIKHGCLSLAEQIK